MEERFSPKRIEEEGERTQTAGLPLFEWARSEQIREQGRAALREEMAQDAPDYRYVADIAGILAERLPQRSLEAAHKELPQEEVRQHDEVSSVQDIVQDIAVKEGQYFMRRFVSSHDHFDPFDTMVAASLHAIDPERFDHEVSADVRERLWTEAMRQLTENDRGASPMIHLMKLDQLRQLDLKRFAKEVDVAGEQWASLRDALGGMLNDKPYHAVYAAVIAKRVFGQDALAPHAECIARQWGRWNSYAQEEMRYVPVYGVGMIGALQEIAPEGKKIPYPTHEQWLKVRAHLELQQEPSPIRLATLASLVNLQVEQ